MKQVIITTLAVGLMGTGFLRGDRVEIADHGSKKVFAIRTSPRDHVYVGPAVFWTNEAPHIKGVHIRDKSVYYGVRVGGDFLRPEALYVGADILYALGRMHIRTAVDKTHIYREKATGSFANAEVRAGYNLQSNERLFLTPFVGLGGYHTRPQSIHYVQNWLYAAVGLKTNYDVNRHLNLGLHLKGTRAIYLEQRIKGHHQDVARHTTSNALGYEVALPVTVHLGHEQQWDMGLEPYYLKLNSQSRANIWGGQMAFTVRF